jgi:hypothetical protein
MSNKDPQHGQEPGPKGLNLDALMPAKMPVGTSIGTLYVRLAYTTDWETFDIDDIEKLGKAAIRQLISRIEYKHDSAPLSDEDLEVLTDEHSSKAVLEDINCLPSRLLAQAFGSSGDHHEQ